MDNLEQDAAVNSNPESPNPGQSEADRPNTNYNLSMKTQDKDNLTFYYSRESRLAKAPEVVRNLYVKKKPKTRFGIFGSLFGNKGNVMIFGSIIIVCAAIMLIRILNPQAAYELEGNSIAIQAVKYEGTIIVLMEKTITKGQFWKQAAPAYTGLVEIGASPVQAAETDESPFIFMHRVFFTASEKEEYRFALPFETDDFILVLQTDNKQISLKISTL